MRCTTALLLASVVAATATAAVAAETNFDGFLAEFDHACKPPPAFRAFRNSIVAVYGDEEGRVRGNVAMPGAFAAWMGPITKVDRGNYVDVTVRLEGTFRGLRPTKLLFSIGKGNGIGVDRLEFADPPARVRAVLGAAVTRGKKVMAAEDDAGIGMTTDLDFTKGTSAVFCDFST